MVAKKDLLNIKKGLGHLKTFDNLSYNGALVKFFGCLRCSWAGTTNCPHNIQRGNHHANWICSVRMEYLKKRMDICGNIPKVIQQEELFKLSQISEMLLVDYYEFGDLPEEFKNISKLIISLTDKMRRQDEGIKVQGELTVSHEDFKNMVEVEAKKIEERNNRTRQAEFKEEVRDS